jgi:ribosome biogenesis GTPase
VRTLRPSTDAAALALACTDVESLPAQCRFRDCTHLHEPGCSVRDGLDPDRLRNFHKMLREARHDTMTALDRRKQVADWKARGKLAQQRINAKRGAGR